MDDSTANFLPPRDGEEPSNSEKFSDAPGDLDGEDRSIETWTPVPVSGRKRERPANSERPSDSSPVNPDGDEQYIIWVPLEEDEVEESDDWTYTRVVAWRIVGREMQIIMKRPRRRREF
jgi:hypothetical protein